MSGSSAYSTRVAQIPADRDRLLAVWDGSLGERQRMERKFRWFYEEAPGGAPVTMLLEWQESPSSTTGTIGVATAGRREFQHGGRNLAAGVLVDMAVRVEHRTL